MDEDWEQQSNPGQPITIFAGDTVADTSIVDNSENFRVHPVIAAKPQHPVIDLYCYFGQVWMLPLAIMLGVMSAQRKGER